MKEETLKTTKNLLKQTEMQLISFYFELFDEDNMVEIEDNTVADLDVTIHKALNKIIDCRRLLEAFERHYLKSIREHENDK